ncbi:acetyl-coenzyme A synthetase 2 [Datura stramonium]|uniref:Acetyl-coenzyme A synthetase 2 n=1 Tax=Datura stramonium TaxID=4076 RepID=A0ABS8SY68_DATST|nr:acetyl-coenzyme A synthetase 2 [Datura stramonium]
MARTRHILSGGKHPDNDPFHLVNNLTGLFKWVSLKISFLLTWFEKWIRETQKLPFVQMKELNLSGPLLTSKIIMACLNSQLFNRDLRWRTGVQLLPISCKSSNNFKITIEAVKETYQKAQEANIKVKGLILTNPCNPLGTVLDRDTLINLLTFTDQHNIHLVCDEIYAATVFDAPQFVSIAEIINDDDGIGINKNLTHVCQSFQRYRFSSSVGIVYSFNDEVVNCARKMSSFGLVSTQTQHLLASMLSDDEFVEEFLVESAKRLRKRHEKFTGGLEKVGIKCLKSNAGVYCWMDLRPLLKEETVDAEVALWKMIIKDVKLNVSPGSSFNCPDAGWFRVCFANIDEQTVDIALARIQTFVDAKLGNGRGTTYALTCPTGSTMKML